MRETSASRQAAWRALVALVAATLRDEPCPSSVLDGVSRVDERSLVRLAQQHGVGALSAEALRGAGRPVPVALSGEVVQGAARHLRALDDLDRVRSALDGAAVPWLVAKGPVLAPTWFGHPFLRAYDDVDVYVTPADFGTAVRSLVEVGGVVADTDDFLRRVVPGEVRIVLAPDAAVDLHWQPFFYRVHARRFPVGVAEMLSRAREWRAADDREVLIPSTTDGLVHLCLHAAISGGDRLSWLVDIDRYLTSWPVEPADLRVAIGRWQAGAAVALMLARADTVLGSAPARRLLHGLPLSRRITAAGTERWRGPQQPIGPVRTAAARSAGATLSSSVGWAARAGLRRVVPTLQARRATPPLPPGDYFASVAALGGGNSSASS